MKALPSLLVSALLLTLLLAAFVYLQPQLPTVIPVHWNARGQINGYATPWHLLRVGLLVQGGLVLLTLLLPQLSPRGFEIKPFQHVFVLLMLAVQAALVCTFVGVLLRGAGHAVGRFVVSVPLGVLLIVLGNYMGKLRKNFYIGIRTPWTIASDEVWERTHRFGGRVFVLAGVLLCASALFALPASFTTLVVLAAALITAGYSWLAYQRLSH